MEGSGQRRHRPALLFFAWLVPVLLALVTAVALPTQVQGLITSTWARMPWQDSNCEPAITYEHRAAFGDLRAARDVRYKVSASEEYSGRVDVAVTIPGSRQAEATGFRFVLISGLYGTGEQFAYALPSLSPLWNKASDGDCRLWAHAIGTADDVSRGVTTIFPGLWGERDYCISVLSTTDDERAVRDVNNGDYVMSEPVCFTTSWDVNWGAMHIPP